MTDKEKIRKEVEKLKSNLIYGACSSQIAIETRCKEEAYNKVLAMLDSEQEEHVSIWHDASEKPERDDLLIETNDGRIIHRQSVNNYGMVKRWAYTSALLNLDNSCNLGNNSQEEPVSEDLGEYINELSKQFPEVSFAKLSRIVVRVAKWQKEQFEKNRLAHCDAQTEEEAEREWNFCMSILNYEHRQPTYDDAIKYGMRLQKEQMMAKAVDGDITFDYYGDGDKTYGCIAHDSFCLEDFGLKDRDKVKMILIKE